MTERTILYGDYTPHGRGCLGAIAAGAGAVAYACFRFGKAPASIVAGAVVLLLAIGLAIVAVRSIEMRIDRTRRTAELRRRFVWRRPRIDRFDAATATEVRLARLEDGDWHLSVVPRDGAAVEIDGATDVAELHALATDVSEALGVPVVTAAA